MEWRDPALVAEVLELLGEMLHARPEQIFPSLSRMGQTVRAVARSAVMALTAIAVSS